MKCLLFALLLSAACADDDNDNNGGNDNQREEEADGSYFEWADYKSCASVVWLNVYSDDAADCAGTIISDELKNLCSRTSFIHAGHYDGNCGCIQDSSVDCTLAENQVYDANVTLYAFGQCGEGFCQVADRKSCTSTLWLDVYTDDAASCYDTVTADEMMNLCSQDFFVYAGHMDGNCGCIADASVNCTLSAYQQGDYNSTIYAITTTTTTTQAGRRRRQQQSFEIAANRQHARSVNQAANEKRSFHHAAGKKHFSRHASNGKPTLHSFHQLADNKVCSSVKWLDVRSKSASACLAVIKQNKACSQRFFSHAGHTDGNCGCLTDAGVDCSLATNQIVDSAVTTYQVALGSAHRSSLLV